MRHKVVKKTFGRRHGPRKALMKSLAESLVEHGRIKTTLPKAKELRKYVEKAITTAKKDSVHSRRLLLKVFHNKEAALSLSNDVVKRFEGRNGGYTRIVKLGARTGDKAPMAFIEFVDHDITVTDEMKTKREETVKANEELAAQRAKELKKSKRMMQNASRNFNRP